MKFGRSTFTLVLLGSAALCACKSDPPAPQADPAASAAAAASAKAKNVARAPVNPAPKVDPQTLKEYRVDACYFGTQTLRYARDAYLASLGGAEPSEKKIPNFGTAAPAKAPEAKPAGSAAASARPEMRRPFEFGLRAPHERNARSCAAAVSLKDPAMPDIDAVLTPYATFASDLAKDLAAAINYYQREEYKKDSFEKGKELHKKLLANFPKLDEQLDKLGVAVEAWHKEHPSDASKLEEPQKSAVVAYDEARALMVSTIQKKVDVEAFKGQLAKLDKSLEALRTQGTNNPTDPWAKILGTPLDSFAKAAKELEGKLGDKTPSFENLLATTTQFTSVVEAKNRALSRHLALKAQPAQPDMKGPDMKGADAPGDGHQPAAPVPPPAEPAK